ncbi:unnamed protein product [Brassicogethes aeneus]|uniref:Ankyrin repeat, SAM and basic leucine zipper domain-containing protein 1 n=1 Tax=Brassicogethes aeneus TaxID=1431903 RepID=A0A9P0FJ92_BRAAE|nr:unnamed protein product [Brassicogethes aeneus]
MSRYAPPPDYSDNSDGFSDDGDFVNYQERIQNHKDAEIKLSPEELEKKNREIAINSLFNGVCYGNLNTVIEELDKGIEVDIDLNSGWTALLLACSYGHTSIAKEIIHRGANVNSHRDGFSALMMACNCPPYTATYENTLEIIKLLVEKGANPKLTDRKRMSAIMFASGNGHLEAVKFLYPLSENEIRDNQGWTALFWAINSNHVNVVEYLWDEGVDFTKADIRGHTPLDLAKLNDFQDIVKIFAVDEDIYVNYFDSSNSSNLLDVSDIKKPKFFNDICNILFALRSENVIKHFHDKNISLVDFLSSNDDDLKNLGILMPYQRRKILNGLYKFHKHPYHPKSLLVVKLKDIYTNIDVATQVVASIKQFIAMEASLNYILKNSNNLDKKDIQNIKNSVAKIRREINSNQIIAKGFLSRAEDWDSKTQPADLITKKSTHYIFPWRKLVFLTTLSSLIAYRYILRHKLT